MRMVRIVILQKKFKSYGIKLSYVLAPETADMILSALEKNALLNKAKER